jgi:SRF-type transcription factor (DNA-binding and dimerisation domain)
MGRKKIEIKFIENKKERVVVSCNQVTFCKRKHGLLKKAAELATLCGVKVCLLFTDLGESVHYFSNEPGIKLEFDHTLKKKRDGAFMYTYTLEDVAFIQISTHSR